MRLKIIYILSHLLLWLGMYLLLSPIPLSIVAVEFAPLSEQEISIFLLYGFALNIGLIYSYAHLVFPAYLRQPKLTYLLLINLIYLLLFSLVESTVDFLFFDYVYSHNTFKEEAQTFDQLSMTNLLLNFFMLLTANLYGLAYAWFKETNTRKTLEREKLKAELSALRHQVHPHFLFNILNGLYGLAYKNDDEPTAEGIAKLSQMMRYMLYESNDEKVPLDKEIQYIDNYIDLQRLRTNGLTKIDFKVNGEAQGKTIVPMILIPFIENAFKHGVSTVNPSNIFICLDIKEEHIDFQVKNAIHRKSSSKDQPEVVGGVGLTNVKQRLKLVYKNAYNLKIDTSDNIYHVFLTLPL